MEPQNKTKQRKLLQYKQWTCFSSLVHSLVVHSLACAFFSSVHFFFNFSTEGQLLYRIICTSFSIDAYFQFYYMCLYVCVYIYVHTHTGMELLGHVATLCLTFCLSDALLILKNWFCDLIHVEVWQKTTKFCKAIILKLKKKEFLGSTLAVQWLGPCTFTAMGLHSLVPQTKSCGMQKKKKRRRRRKKKESLYILDIRPCQRNN